MMKTILIAKDNVENFAEEMFKFNCNNTYNSLCFSCSDIKREQHALNCTDAIIEEMDKAGFDMTAIQTFKQHNWKVDDLVSTNKDNPVLYFTCNMYENYGIHQKKSCILDDINQPFVIGAGDANATTSYIGEYAMKWNERISKS